MADPPLIGKTVMRHYVSMSLKTTSALVMTVGLLLAPQIFADPPKIEARLISGDLAEMLGKLQIVAEATYPESATFVRIYRVTDDGECDGSPVSCPKSTLYLTVSEFGEAPSRRVFQLPKRHKWEFLSWVRLPKPGDPDESVTLRLRAAVPRKVTTESWWDSFELEIVASPYEDPILRIP